jgi:hypothetical protein
MNTVEGSKDLSVPQLYFRLPFFLESLSVLNHRCFNCLDAYLFEGIMILGFCKVNLLII